MWDSVYTCVLKFTAWIAFLLYLDDVMGAFKKRRGLDISDCYSGERMESNSACEKEKKQKERQKILQKLWVHKL